MAPMGPPGRAQPASTDGDIGDRTRGGRSSLAPAKGLSTTLQPTDKQPLVRFAGRLAGVIRFSLGSVLDFLVEDGCALCRRAQEPLGTQQTTVADPVRHLLEPVSVRRFFGVLKAVNHPVCARCAGEFVVAHSTGALGRVIGADGIETALGEIFGGASEPGLPTTPPDVELRLGLHEGGEPASARGAETGPGSPRDETIRIVSPFMTSDAALNVMHLLKFGGYVELVLPVAQTMGWAIRRSGLVGHGGAAILVPTPMDRRSQRQRGFNQAERIARELAVELGHPIAAGVLLKRPGTKRQSRTPREARARNVRNAFWCPPSSVPQLAGRTAILVDDLVTTGATAAACAAALLGAGARQVVVVCFGRAM